MDNIDEQDQKNFEHWEKLKLKNPIIAAVFYTQNFSSIVRAQQAGARVDLEETKKQLQEQHIRRLKLAAEMNRKQNELYKKRGSR